MIQRSNYRGRPPAPSARSARPRQHRFPGLATLLVAAVIIGGAIAVATWFNSTDRVSLSKLLVSTHVHGMAVDPKDPKRLYLATHTGFSAVGKDAIATRLSEIGGSYVLHLAAAPQNGNRLYAATIDPATHRGEVLASIDGGHTWSRFGAP